MRVKHDKYGNIIVTDELFIVVLVGAVAFFYAALRLVILLKERNII